MTFASAYLIVTKVAESDDPAHPPQTEETKSWFKKLFREHPMDFPQYMGIEYDLYDGFVVTEVRNEDTAYIPDYIRDEFVCYIEGIDTFPESPSYWVSKHYGDYTSPGMFTVFPDTYFYRIWNGVVRVEAHMQIRKTWDRPGHQQDESYFTVNQSDFASALSKCLYVRGSAETKGWAYPIGCQIRVPVFSNIEDGTAYARAVTEYYNNPTQANYDALCNYIDICENPDG